MQLLAVDMLSCVDADVDEMDRQASKHFALTDRTAKTQWTPQR